MSYRFVAVQNPFQVHCVGLVTGVPLVVWAGSEVFNKAFFKRCREFADGDPCRLHTASLSTDQLVAPSGRVCQNLDTLPDLRAEFLTLARCSKANVNSTFGRRGFDAMILLASSFHVMTPLDPENSSDWLVSEETLTRWRNGGGQTQAPMAPDLLYSCTCQEYTHYLQVHPRNPNPSTLNPKP